MKLAAAGLGLLAAALAIAAALSFALLGCAAPEPFQPGETVPPPPGCQTLRDRGGEC